MKKRVLSMLLAFTLCFSTVPMTAFAQGTEAMAEQTEQEEAEPAAVQEEAEAVATPETPVDESTTAEDSVADEEIDIVSPADESVSDGDAGASVTAEDTDELQVQLMAMNEDLAVQSEEHKHPICGVSCAHTDGEHEDVTFRELTPEVLEDCKKTVDSSEYYELAEGSYYLNSDLKLDLQLFIKDNVDLCLNGHSITLKKGSAIIKVYTGGTFTLTDCNGSNGEYHFQKNTVKDGTTESVYNRYGVWELNDSGNIAVNGGVIIQEYGKHLESVSVSYGGIFNMYGGTICGHLSPRGAAYVGTRGTFNMYGGAIKGNKSSFTGGGVWVNDGTFNMSGDAVISENTANTVGGGVCVSGGTFNISGDAVISANTVNTLDDGTMSYGGGVYVDGGTFNLSGAPVIIGNTKEGDSKPNNIYLPDGATIQINGRLTGDVHSIGVSTENEPAAASPVTIATAAKGYTLTEEDVDRFTSDADSIYPVLADGEVQLATTAPHRHYLCGEEHQDVGDHTTDSQMTFTKLWMDDGGKLMIGDTELTETASADNENGYLGNKEMCYELPAGNYYLGSSITLDYPIYIASNLTLPKDSPVPTSNDVKLCLNGNTIKANGDFSAIVCSSALSKTTFTLTDCQQTAGTITHTADTTGSGVILYSQWVKTDGNGTRFHMYGGNITDNTAERGGGVNIVARGDGGIFNLYGGVISDNKANDAGGGVYVYGRGSVFTLYDGKITNNSAGTDGGGVSAASNDFYMNGGSITGNTAAKGGGVSVGYYSSADFTMNGGEIKSNMASDNGGGVYVETSYSDIHLSGTVNITGNTTNNNANNVYLPSDAVITVGNLDTNTQIPVTLEKMPTSGFYVKFARAGAGAELTDNTAAQFIIENDDSDKYGKWIIENKPAELYLYVIGDKPHEHAICGNYCNHETKHSKALWTPLTYDETKQQLMYGSLTVPSEVTKVSATNEYYMTYKLPAGNYYLADTIEMKGGEITYNGNTVTSKGGVIEIGTDVNLCLNGKWLVTSAPYIGVIVIEKAGALTLSDCEGVGEIRSYCNAYAGVQIAGDTYDHGEFTMYDGIISYTATGVLMGDNSIFNMYGGTIINNETGVSINSTSKLTVGGSAKITDNDNKNVFLYDKAMITIDSSLTNGASIGVTTEKDPTDETPIQIATGATSWVSYTGIFEPDGTKGYVITKDEQGRMYLNVHIHNWIYESSADYQTIIANCDVTGCPIRKTGYVTISEPKHVVYGDGETADATLTPVDWQADAYSVTYKKGNDILTEAPTDAGTYTASITLGSKTAWVKYEIKKADPAVKNFVFTAPDNLIYDGKAKTAEVKAVTDITGMGDVTVKYYQGETEVQPINAGEYTVKISVADGTNFNAASNLEDASWAFTIAAVTTEPTVELSSDTGYTYTGKRITPEVTVTIGDTTLVEGTDYTITYGDNTNAGTDAGSVTIKAKGNYGFADVTKTFTIEKADPGLRFEKDAVTVTWGDPTPSNPLIKPDDVTVTYTSSNEGVAFFDPSNDIIIIKGVGTTTITATSAETTNYKEGTASYTFTMNKGTLRIVGAEVNNKVYDGNTTAEISKVFFESQDGKSCPLNKEDYTATGTFAESDAGNWQVTVKVSLKGSFDETFQLESNTFTTTTTATITPKPISIADVTTENRSYKRNDTSVTITGATFNDADGKPVTTLTSSDYTVTGVMTDANIGTDKEVVVTVTLQGDAANNYSLVSNTTTAKVTINKATGGALTGDNFRQKFSDRKQKTFAPDYTGLPDGETWTYSISDAQTSGSAKVETVKIDAAGEITYTLTEGAENDTVRWTVTISNPNYEDFTKDLVLTLTAKDPQETLCITGDDTVVYGRTLQLSTVGGSGTGEITYRVDAGSTGAATIGEDGVLTPDKVGSVVIIATKAGDADYSEITSAPFVITITQAATSGEPKYTEITTGGKTLGDAGLTLTGSTFDPAEGTLE